MMHAPSTVPSSPYREPAAVPGARLVSTSGRVLPLLGTTLTADAAGGIARVTLEQRFKNAHAEPLAVTYSLPLPSDGAVGGFAFRIGDRRVVGEIDRRQAARERYEQALVEGRSAALLEQDRSSLFTQEIGNIPPGEEVVVEVHVDQRLRWLDEGAWEWRFPTVVGPRYLGEPGRTPDAARIAQDVADGPLGARVSLACFIRDALATGRTVESPSHAVDGQATNGAVHVSLRDKEGARLDRDVVVRWPVATPKVGVSIDVARSSRPALASRAHALLTLVPPTVQAERPAVSRDLIVLLDTSGSMSGEPLAQSVRVASALVSTLRDGDQLELIEFSSSARRWRARPVAATASARKDALAWLAKLRASGSTDMHSGILAALEGLRPGAQRQVVLVTDGMIGFEAQIVAAISDKLPVSSRVHTVGVGSAVNRSLTGPAARAGHGVEIILGLGEDPERAVARIVARTNAPLIVDLAVEGSAVVETAPAKLPDLFAGAPALVGAALRPEGGEIVVRGRTPDGSWEQRLQVKPVAEGHGSPALVALFGREVVEDLETRLAAGEHAEIDPTIEQLGIDFQIATRLTSWVAVSDEATVDPTDPTRRERMPHELPYGMSAEGVGLRPSSIMPMSFGMVSGNLTSAAAGAEMPVTRAASAPPGFGAPPPRGLAPLAASKVDLRAILGKTQVQVPNAPLGGATKGESKEQTRVAFEELEEAPDLVDTRDLDSSAPPPPRPRRGVLGWLGDLLGGTQKAPAAPRTLRGRVAGQRAAELTIDVFAEGEPLTWEPASVARIVLEDGTVVEARVEATHTTKAGVLAVGTVARLGLVHGPARVVGAFSIELELGGVTVIIVIE